MIPKVRPGALIVGTLVGIALPAVQGLAGQAGAGRDGPFEYGAPEDVGLSAAAVGDLPVRLAEWVRDGELVGAEVLLVKDRKIVLHDVVGWSDREAGTPLRRNSIYHIASMTKPFTGTAVLMLADEGRIALDDPVARWLPSWDTPASRHITVRQLLTHTAGWANEGPGPSTPLAEYAGVRALADRVGSQGPMYAPGEMFRYGDAHSYTLAALVGEVSGMSAEAFIQQRILDPLGLEDTRTVFQAADPSAGRVNPTYRSEDGEWVQYWHPTEGPGVPYFYGAGGMYSTAEDYARWLQAWMDWIDPDRASVSNLVSEDQARAAVRPGALHPGYGLHWYVYATDPLVFGHGGADGTRAYAVPSERAILVILTQSRSPAVRQHWPGLLESVLPSVALGESLPEVGIDGFPDPVVSLEPSEHPRFVGEFAVGSDTISVSERDGRLRFETGFWRPYDLVPLGDDVFAMGVFENGQLVRIAGPAARVRFMSAGGTTTSLQLLVLPEGRVDFEAARVR